MSHKSHGVSNHWQFIFQQFVNTLQQRKDPSSTSLAHLRRIHWSPVDSPHRGSVMQKGFPCHDIIKTLQSCHNGRDGVSNHQLYHCLLNRLFRRKSKKTLKFRVTGHLCGEFTVRQCIPAKMASNAENVSIWWRHHGEESTGDQWILHTKDWWCRKHFHVVTSSKRVGRNGHWNAPVWLSVHLDVAPFILVALSTKYTDCIIVFSFLFHNFQKHFYDCRIEHFLRNYPEVNGTWTTEW